MEMAQLTPWLSHARIFMYGALDDLAEPNDLDEDLWIAWSVPNRPDGTDGWIETLEAIEILDLYVRVDYHAAWTWILHTLEMSVYIPLLTALPDKIYPKHTLTYVDLEDSNGLTRARAHQLIFAIPEASYSPDFWQIRSEMMHLWHKEKRAAEERICLRIEVEMNAAAPNEEANMLHDLVELAALVYDPHQQLLLQQLNRISEGETDEVTQAPSDVFCIEWMDFSTGQTTLTDSMLTNMRAIDRCGVRISDLWFGRVYGALDQLELRGTADFLRSLVLPEGHTTTVVLSRPLQPVIFQALCSALAATRTVNDVSIMVRSASEDFWAWIAYVLFSGDIPNRIEYTHLNVEGLTLQDVGQVERVLGSSNPLDVFAPRNDGRSPRERIVVDVRPNTLGVVWTNPKATFISIDELDATNLRVIDESFSQTHVCVLYPGAGIVWIPRNRIVARRKLPLRTPRGLLRRIGFEIGANTSLETLLPLLQVVGPLARIVSLHTPQATTLSDDFMRGVLAACPNLERLDLTQATLSSFTWLSDNDAVHIKALRCTWVRCLDPQGFGPVFAALSAPETSLCRSLREVSIRTEIGAVRPAWPVICEMLTKNHRLERVFIRAENIPVSEDFETLAAQIQRQNDEPLYVQDKPLPVRHRLAFLSVFCHQNRLPELDTAMVSMIFDLAALNKRRVCALLRKPRCFA